MTLAEFKGIFWWEYFHRLLGRADRRRVPRAVPVVRRAARFRRLRVQLRGIFVLGGLQGALGWYMVQSGLVDDPRVSQFRLTAHLGLAFVIFGAMQWVALSLLAGPRAAPRWRRTRDVRRFAFCGALVFAQVLTGGLVAGIRAGFAYNTFPLDERHVVPPEILMLEPWWKNFFYNMATVQFDHRRSRGCSRSSCRCCGGACTGPGHAGARRTGAHLLLAMLAVQVALGIVTLVLSCRCRSRRCTRPAPCWCSRSLSTSRTHCAGARQAVHRIRGRAPGRLHNYAIMRRFHPARRSTA